MPIFQLKKPSLKEVTSIAKVRDQPGIQTQVSLPRSAMNCGCQAEPPSKEAQAWGRDGHSPIGAEPVLPTGETPSAHWTGRSTDSDSVGPGPANMSRPQVFA